MTDDEMPCRERLGDPLDLGGSLFVAPLGEAAEPERTLGREAEPARGRGATIADLHQGSGGRRRLGGLRLPLHELTVEGAHGFVKRGVRRHDALRDQPAEIAVPGADLQSNPFVELLQRVDAQLLETRTQAAVREDRVSQTNDRRLLAQPASVLATRAERLEILDETGWVAAHPLVAVG